MIRTIRTLVALAAMGVGFQAAAQSGARAPADSGMMRMAVNGGELEYTVRGEGEPVLLIHGTGVAATFAPTMAESALDGYRLIRYHRRGFAGSTRTTVPFTIADHAADARALLEALNVERAAAPPRCSLRLTRPRSCIRWWSSSRRCSIRLRLPHPSWRWRPSTEQATDSPRWIGFRSSLTARTGARSLHACPAAQIKPCATSTRCSKPKCSE